MSFLIHLLILCAIAGIVWWIFTQIPMPEPLRIVVLVIFGIMAIYLLADLGGVGLKGFGG